MSTEPYTPDDVRDQEADQQADAMKAQLRKDVASWSKARSETSQQLVVEPSLPPARQPALSSAAKPPRKSKRADAPVKPVPISAKPFSMSYDGGSTADYIQYMIDRGAR